MRLSSPQLGKGNEILGGHGKGKNENPGMSTLIVGPGISKGPHGVCTETGNGGIGIFAIVKLR